MRLCLPILAISMVEVNTVLHTSSHAFHTCQYQPCRPYPLAKRRRPVLCGGSGHLWGHAPGPAAQECPLSKDCACEKNWECHIISYHRRAFCLCTHTLMATPQPRHILHSFLYLIVHCSCLQLHSPLHVYSYALLLFPSKNSSTCTSEVETRYQSCCIQVSQELLSHIITYLCFPSRIARR